MGLPLSSVYSWLSLTGGNIPPAPQAFGIRSYFPYSWLSLTGGNISPAPPAFGIRFYFPDCGAYWVLVLRGYKLQLIPRIDAISIRTMRGEIWLDLELFATMRRYFSAFAYVFAEHLTPMDRLNITDDVWRDLE